MRFRIAAFVIGVVFAVGILEAQSSTTIRKVPLQSTSAASGKEMFSNYCAACHGADGTGNGPAAPALKTAPANLTQLAVKADGKFPEDRIAAILSGMGTVAAHGTSEMPVWGDLFKSLGNHSDLIVRLRITNLTSYVKSIQAK